MGRRWEAERTEGQVGCVSSASSVGWILIKVHGYVRIKYVHLQGTVPHCGEEHGGLGQTIWL